MLSSILFTHSLVAQNENNYHSFWIFPTADTLALDTLSIIAETVSFYPEKDSSVYIDHERSLYYFPASSSNDSIRISYRTFSVRLLDPIASKDDSIISSHFIENQPSVRYTEQSAQKGLITMDGLQKSGNISRGVLGGNNRNVSVNSDLNLQLSGKIAENVEILASITDNNIPIQPSGNTQQIQDFDKIFIQVFNDEFKLIAGDYEMINSSAHFLKYNKKNLGLSFDLSKEIKKDALLGFTAAAALSKGKFARNEILGKESLQGPYRLKGQANESFIIVLSGTERVYIDGVLLQRGSNKDYVINYNSAEITFTPKILITKDKRITVEFQYSDKNYFRSLVQAGSTYKKKNFDAFINIYSEQDAKSQPLQQSLSEADKNLLASVGNQTDQAVSQAIDSVGYDENRVMYALTDSLGYDSVFVVSTDPAIANYQLSFSQLSSGIGDYIQGEFTANGRTFLWVAPDTINGMIVHNGEFAPVRKLIAPQTHQMISAGGNFRPNESTEIRAELSYTHLDPNTFSELQNNENHAWATSLEGKKAFRLSKKEDADKLELFGNYEYVTQLFKPIERFRSVEFNRDWNVAEVNDSISQQLWELGAQYSNNKWASLSYSYRDFRMEDVYNGQKHKLSISLQPGILSVDYNGSLLSSEETFRSDFYRHKSVSKLNFPSLSIGLQDEFENNVKNLGDSILPESYQFYDYKAFIESSNDKVNKWKVYGGQRLDWKTRSILTKSSTATNLGAEFHYLKSRVHRINARLNYRELLINDDSLSLQAPESNLLGRLEYVLNAGKGSVNWNVFYEIGSGLDQLREYFYQEVSQGLGVYEWIDLNEDGIKGLNEFFISQNPALANYIRVFTPNNNFIRVYNAQFSQNLSLNPMVVWRDKSGIRKAISRFSTQTQYSINKKTQSGEIAKAYNPFYNPNLDSSLMSFNNTFRNTIFFNRSYTKYSIEYTFLDNSVKTLLLNGFQTIGKTTHFIKIRWNVTQKYTLLLSGDIGEDFSASDFISDRNYTIEFKKIAPEFRYQPSPAFRVSLNGDYTKKQNLNSELEQYATIVGLGLESRYNIVSKGSMFANIKFSNIDYTGPQNTPSQIEMLETLRPGLNLTWSITWQWNITTYLQLSANYNGKKSETASAIHVGGIDVRAFF